MTKIQKKMIAQAKPQPSGVPSKIAKQHEQLTKDLMSIK